MISRTQLICLAIFFAAIFTLPLVVRPFQMTVLTNMGLYTLLALSMCAIVSYAGQFVLLQTLPAAIAAFCVGIAIVKLGLPFPVGVAIGLVSALVLTAVISTFIFRLRGFYLAIGTLLITLVAPLILANEFRDWTGGYFGLRIPLGTVNVGPLSWDDRRVAFYAMWTFIALVTLFYANLERSRIVRAARAIKANEAAAQLAAIDPLRVKVGMLILSTIVAAMAGILGTASIQYVDSYTYDVNLKITVFAALIVGGRGNLWGALVAGIFITAVSTMFQFIGSRGTIVYGLILVATLLWKPEGLIGFVPMIQKRFARGAGPELARVVAAPALKREPAAVPASVERRPVLELDHLTVRFGEFVAVDDVSLAVPSGSIVALLGPNGAGKTTIFNAVTGYNRPASGAIRFAGTDIASWSTYKVRRAGVSRTLQIPHVFGEMTTWENVAIGLDFLYPHGIVASGLSLPSARRSERDIRAAALALCARVGLQQMAFRPARQLSFGQSRLVDVARAMAGTSRLLLLDEPFAGLAVSMIGTMKELLVDLKEQGYTILLIDHNFEHVSEICTEGHLLVAGKLARSGPIQELLRDDLVIQQYVGV